jgi:hypothetical protein
VKSYMLDYARYLPQPIKIPLRSIRGIYHRFSGEKTIQEPRTVPERNANAPVSYSEM